MPFARSAPQLEQVSCVCILLGGTKASEVGSVHLVVIPFKFVETEHIAEVIRGLFDPERFEEVESS